MEGLRVLSFHLMLTGKNSYFVNNVFKIKYTDFALLLQCEVDRVIHLTVGVWGTTALQPYEPLLVAFVAIKFTDTLNSITAKLICYLLLDTSVFATK